MYEERFYRKKIEDDALITFQVQIEESDLWIISDVKLEGFAADQLKLYRAVLTDYGQRNPLFFESLKPIEKDKNTHPIITEMIEATALAEVGPMASVAGAISKYVGGALLNQCQEVIVENGGDIYMKTLVDRTIAIYAGESKFSNRIGLKIKATDTPIGICTSAGTVGHSLSFGKADAVVVVSEDVILADAVATSIGNIVSSSKDIKNAIEVVKHFNDAIEINSIRKKIKGLIIIIDNELGVWGDIELVNLA